MLLRTWWYGYSKFFYYSVLLEILLKMLKRRIKLNSLVCDSSKVCEGILNIKFLYNNFINHLQ